MIEHPIEGDFKQWVVNAFRQSELFASVDVNSLDKVASLAKLQEYGAGEHILTMGDRPEAFWMLLMGEAVTSVQDGTTGEQVEVASVKANEIVGEASREELRIAARLDHLRAAISEVEAKIHDLAAAATPYTEQIAEIIDLTGLFPLVGPY